MHDVQMRKWYSGHDLHLVTGSLTHSARPLNIVQLPQSEVVPVHSRTGYLQSLRDQC